MRANRNRPLRLEDPIQAWVENHFGRSEADLFGCEIELEGEKVTTNNAGIAELWKQTKDGSLRLRANNPKSECLEYIFRGPLDTKQTKLALTRMFDYLNKTPGVVVFDSYRTSIHVHINCLQETMRTVINFITLAIIFDELFVSQNGQTRIGNNFCLRTRDAEGQVSDLISSITQYGTPFNFSGHNRYSSVNVASLSKFGTIEFRSMECNTDFDRVYHWVGTLQALKEAARKYKDPKEIISKFSQKGPLGFILYNLGQYGSKYTAIPEAHAMLNTGMRLAQDFAYCSEWVLAEKIERKINDPKAMLKKYAQLDAQMGEYVNEIYHHPGHQNQFGAVPQPINWAQYLNEEDHVVPVPGPPPPNPAANPQWGNVAPGEGPLGGNLNFNNVNFDFDYEPHWPDDVEAPDEPDDDDDDEDEGPPDDDF